jgi:rod shape-determining protein MreD
MPLEPRPQQILLPVKPALIAFTLAFALLLNLLPISGFARWVRPDFVALVILYWTVHQPHRFGMGMAFALGLAMDVAVGVLLGQHALAYSLLAFAAITLSRRILWFALWSQALHVAALLVFAQGISALVRLAAGAEFPGWSIVVGPLVGAMLWPVVSLVLLLPQRMPADVDETRAI